MKDVLNQFKRNQVWKLILRPQDRPIIGTKWVFGNKLDESGNIVRNKARPVAQGHNQIEIINFEETFSPVARLEAIFMNLTYAAFKDFKLFQMNVKSAFLNDFIEEEVYVEQPSSFVDHTHLDYVFKLEKT